MKFFVLLTVVAMCFCLIRCSSEVEKKEFIGTERELHTLTFKYEVYSNLSQNTEISYRKTLDGDFGLITDLVAFTDRYLLLDYKKKIIWLVDEEGHSSEIISLEGMDKPVRLIKSGKSVLVEDTYNGRLFSYRLEDSGFTAKKIKSVEKSTIYNITSSGNRLIALKREKNETVLILIDESFNILKELKSFSSDFMILSQLGSRGYVVTDPYKYHLWLYDNSDNKFREIVADKDSLVSQETDSGLIHESLFPKGAIEEGIPYISGVFDNNGVEFSDSILVQTNVAAGKGKFCDVFFKGQLISRLVMGDKILDWQDGFFAYFDKEKNIRYLNVKWEKEK